MTTALGLCGAGVLVCERVGFCCVLEQCFVSVCGVECLCVSRPLLLFVCVRGAVLVVWKLFVFCCVCVKLLFAVCGTECLRL